MAPRRRDVEWEFHRKTIERLYVGKDMGASEVTRILASQGFYVTGPQFKKVMKKWNLTKYYSRKEKNAMLLIQERRRVEEGKATRFRKGGKIVPAHTLTRFKRDQRRRGVGLNPDHTSISGISISTPSEDCESHQQPSNMLDGAVETHAPEGHPSLLYCIGSSFTPIGSPQGSMQEFSGYDGPLHTAIKEGNESVRAVLSTGARVDTMGVGDNMPLHLAAEQGDVRPVQHLLEKRPLLDVLNRELRSPLYNAIVSPGGLPIVEILLKHGADPNLKLGNEDTALHAAVSLGGHGDYGMVELLISHGADITSRNVSNETPLGIAVNRGCFPIVEILLKHGADPNLKLGNEDTALHAAVSLGGHGDYGMVELLVSHGADITSRNVSNETPLGIAVNRGCFPIVGLLLRRCSPAAAIVAKQDRLLLRAERMGLTEIVELLRPWCGVVDEGFGDEIEFPYDVHLTIEPDC